MNPWAASYITYTEGQLMLHNRKENGGCQWLVLLQLIKGKLKFGGLNVIQVMLLWGVF
ncbi:MAG: hypothetical protein CM15mP122_5770 [Bacteroidota bacterium]|nr:MAG: hypothetical protein CM15mP122_5770 [Bacteroidota bacterium]